MMSMPFFTGKFSHKMNRYVPLLSSSILLPEAALLVSKESIEVASRPNIADSYFTQKNASKPKSFTLPMKRKQVVLESFFDSEVRKKSKIYIKKEEEKLVQSLVKKPMPKLQVDPPDYRIRIEESILAVHLLFLKLRISGTSNKIHARTCFQLEIIQVLSREKVHHQKDERPRN